MTITATSPVALPSLPPSPIHGDHRIVFRGVGWHVYESLREAPNEGQHVRLAYDGKDLEIMTTGYFHENQKELLGRFVTGVATWREIEFVSFGEAHWDAKPRGLQADLSYYFDPEKIRMARVALTRKSKDPNDYPSPDLAIEIDESHPQIDRPAIYAALRVVEVWRYARGRKLHIDRLQADGSYAPAEESLFLGISAKEIFGWLTAKDANREAAWNRRLAQWAAKLGRLPRRAASRRKTGGGK
jgi:Uma2 family endonuclease